MGKVAGICSRVQRALLQVGAVSPPLTVQKPTIAPMTHCGR